MSKPQRRVHRLMNLLIVIGLLIAGTGLGLATFTPLATHQGVTGVVIITALIVGGLVISVPAKLYLTLLLMQHGERNRE